MAEVVAVTSSTTVLFVYGTLKRGLGNHRFLAGQEFLGETATEPCYRVIDLRRYPGLILDEANGLAVKGELWSVSARCIEALDEFEGEAGQFVRQPVRIPGRGLVHAYFWNCTIPRDARSGDCWPL